MFETFSADINSMFEFLNENSGSIQALSAVAMLYFTKKLVEVSNSQMDLIKKQQENDRAKLFFYIEGAGDNYIVTFFNTGSKAFILKSLFGDDRKMRFPTEIMSTKKYVSYYVFDPYSAYSFLISHNTKLIRLISPSGVEFKVDVKERFGERIDVPGFDSLPSDAL